MIPCTPIYYTTTAGEFNSIAAGALVTKLPNSTFAFVGADPDQETVFGFDGTNLNHIGNLQPYPASALTIGVPGRPYAGGYFDFPTTDPMIKNAAWWNNGVLTKSAATT